MACVWWNLSQAALRCPSEELVKCHPRGPCGMCVVESEPGSSKMSE